MVVKVQPPNVSFGSRPLQYDVQPAQLIRSCLGFWNSATIRPGSCVRTLHLARSNGPHWEGGHVEAPNTPHDTPPHPLMWHQSIARCAIASWWADWLAIAVAIALPWSTTGSLVLILLWWVARFGMGDHAAVFHEVRTLAGGLPPALCALGGVGILWASVPWADCAEGLSGFYKLLAIPASPQLSACGVSRESRKGHPSGAKAPHVLSHIRHD